LQDAESDQRGHLLTGKESYLAPYLAAVEKTHESLRKLVPIASAIPSGRERLAQIKILSDSKLAELKQIIDLYPWQGLPRRSGLWRPMPAFMIWISSEGSFRAFWTAECVRRGSCPDQSDRHSGGGSSVPAARFRHGSDRA
jgi:hypothetical protein